MPAPKPLADLLSLDDEPTQEAAPESTTSTETPAPRKKSDGGTKAAAAKTTAAKKTSAPKKAPAKKAAESAPKKDDTGTGKDAGPAMRFPATSDASKRVSLYLHPDDYQMLKVAWLEDGADVNMRIRALLALYQHDRSLRRRVDNLATSAKKRQGGHGDD